MATLASARVFCFMFAMLVLSVLYPTAAKAQSTAPASIEMRLLVLSADGNEPALAGIRSVLDQVNVPYDVVIASKQPLTAATLSATDASGNGRGRYQGILLATGSLAYETSPGVYESALSASQWQILWDYERTYRVRQVTLYTYPGGLPESYGMSSPSAARDTTSVALEATLTPEGAQIFNYVNAAMPIRIRNAYTYLAKSAGGTGFKALVSTADGYPIVSTNTVDGRENMAITADGNPELIHTLQLGYGIVNWVSRGFFLGERKVYMLAQPDDLMIADDVWNTTRLVDDGLTEYRTTGADFRQLIGWQQSVNTANPNNAQIKLEMPYNGVGLSGQYSDGSLGNAIRTNVNAFHWISHTYTHALLTDINAADATRELTLNDDVAKKLNFTKYFRDSMIQPEISGLKNTVFLKAAFDFGIRYLLSDTSQPDGKSLLPNVGLPSLQPGILVIPRYPTNLYYNVTTPAEWVSEYNYFYAPGGVYPAWDHRLDYTEILDKESEMLLRYLLKYAINPVMFHQSNLRAYDGVNSLMGDLIKATLAKYNALIKLPVLSKPQHEVGVRMAARMAYNNAGVNGRIVVKGVGVPSVLELTSAVPANAPLTGIAYGANNEVYGGQTISTVAIDGVNKVSIPGPAW